MKGTFADFLQLVVDNPELAEELEKLAARFDFEFSDEVSDEDLDDVAGGVDLVSGRLLTETNLPEQPDDTSNAADTVLSEGQLAAPFIPGGAVLSAAVSGLGQLKSSLGG